MKIAIWQNFLSQILRP